MQRMLEDGEVQQVLKVHMGVKSDVSHLQDYLVRITSPGNPLGCFCPEFQHLTSVQDQQTPD